MLQAVLLTQVMVFCRAHDWRLGLMHKIFFQLYQKDVVFADGFRYWRDALPDTTPQKERALFEVGEFFAWLETANDQGIVTSHLPGDDLILAASNGDTEQLTRVLSLPGIDPDFRNAGPGQR